MREKVVCDHGGKVAWPDGTDGTDEVSGSGWASENPVSGSGWASKNPVTRVTHRLGYTDPWANTHSPCQVAAWTRRRREPA